MPKMVDTTTNTLVDVPHNVASEGFLSGKLDLQLGQPVIMADEKGNLMQVEPKDVQSALTEGGYRFASPESINQADMRAKYGTGLGSSAKAFALGAADVA